MNLVRIAARIANTTIQVDSWTRPRITPEESVSVIFPDGKGPAFSGKFLEYLAPRYNMGMTETEEVFGHSADQLDFGVDLYWDDSEERLWFRIITVEDAILAPEVMNTLIGQYDVEELIARNLESTLTDPAMIAEAHTGR